MNISNSTNSPVTSYQVPQSAVDKQSTDLEQEHARELEKQQKQQKPNETSESANLSEKDKQQLAELKARDIEVKSHEAAHKAAGGSLTGGAASYSYESGPDGRNYAVGGEVSIDTAKVPNDPQATLAKAQTIRAAALAPASPSSQDRAVAASAAAMAAEANSEIMATKLEQPSSEESTNIATKSDSESESDGDANSRDKTVTSAPISLYQQTATDGADKGGYLDQLV